MEYNGDLTNHVEKKVENELAFASAVDLISSKTIEQKHVEKLQREELIQPDKFDSTNKPSSRTVEKEEEEKDQEKNEKNEKTDQWTSSPTDHMSSSSETISSRPEELENPIHEKELVQIFSHMRKAATVRLSPVIAEPMDMRTVSSSLFSDKPLLILATTVLDSNVCWSLEMWGRLMA